MRRLFLLVPIILVSIVCFLPKNAERAYADDVGISVEETLDSIDLSAFDELLRELGENNGFVYGIRKTVEDILEGKNVFDFSYFLSLLGEVFLGELKNTAPHLIAILVIGILFGLLKNTTFGFSKVDVTKVTYVVCYGSIIAVLAHLAATSVVETKQAIGFLQKMADGCFPVLITLVAAVGGTTSGAVFHPLVLTFGAVLLQFVTTAVIPLFSAALVFGLVGQFTDAFKLDKLAKTIRTFCFWSLGAIFGLFSTLLAAEGIVGANMDGLAARGAKFALSSYVPVVGSYIKDTFDIVVAGCLAVKNALGLCAVVLLIVSIVGPIVRIGVLSLGLKLTAGILEPVGEEKMSNALSATADSFKILLSAVACAGFSGIVFLMTIIFVCNVGFV